MVGLAGLEPAPSSLSAIEGSAPCGPPFPQVTAERQARSYAFLARHILRGSGGGPSAPAPSWEDRPPSPQGADPAGSRQGTAARTIAMTQPPQERTTAVAWELAPEVYCLGPRGRTQTNIYFVRAGSSWTLIDTGWPKDGPAIQQAAESLFGADTPPASILLTHSHLDHAGAARQLARRWDC